VAPQQPEQPAEPYVPGDGEETGGGAGAGTPDGGADPGQGSGQDDAPEDGTGNGEVWAAERQAHRAAAVAASEGFHPLRIRPYVAEPGGEPGSATVRPLTTVDGAGPADADLSLLPAMYSGLEYPQEEPEEPDYADLSAEVRGRHRRRRRGIVITAAVAASALAAGAVAVTGQVMTDEPGRTDRALPDQGLSMPDVTLPADAARATGKAAPAITRRPAPAKTSPTPSASPSVTPTPATTAPAPSAPAAPAMATGTVTLVPEPAATAPAESPVAPSADPVLQLGDNGPAVADLQRRLALVWVYHRRADGDFDRDVAEAVATFQVWYGVTGDPSGVYGPPTRSVLERQTSSRG
jgi:hypothetical protein